MTPLRKEVESSQYAAFEKTAQGLPLLDSFIKESARLTPVESSKSNFFRTHIFFLTSNEQ